MDGWRDKVDFQFAKTKEGERRKKGRLVPVVSGLENQAFIQLSVLNYVGHYFRKNHWLV